MNSKVRARSSNLGQVGLRHCIQRSPSFGSYLVALWPNPSHGFGHHDNPTEDIFGDNLACELQCLACFSQNRLFSRVNPYLLGT